MRHACRYRGSARHAEGALALTLWEAGARAVAEEGEDLVAYFEGPVADVPAGGSWERVDDRDYVAEYFAALDPVDVGAIVIAPTHRPVTLTVTQRVLWLDPGMAFGTGHHESTRLVLACLGRLDLMGRSVLDVGAGSGILAIAADTLGAATAFGIDVDADTLPIATTNAARNRSRATFAVGDFTDFVSDRAFDVVVANLVAELHVRFMGAYASVLRPGGDLVLSGIVEGRLAAVTGALAPPLVEVGRSSEGVWWALHVRSTTAAATP
jgi:ribosomal protein L11 methyltransferase